MHHTELLQLAGIVVVGVGCQYVAHFLKLPAIIILLLVGLVVGPILERLGAPHLDPDHLLGDLLMPIVSLSVALILYEGGLTLRFKDIPGGGRVVGKLVTVGALITWLGAALGARFIVGFDWRLSILLGAILVVTGPTVVNPLVRHIKPSGLSGPILRWEGIVIDPIGAMLAVLVFEALMLDATGFRVIESLLLTVFIGGALGLVAAGLLVLLLKKYWVPDSLANPLSMSLALLAFVLSNVMQAESGLLAVTVMGIALANQRWVDVRHIAEFKENLRTLLLGVLFIVLAARVDLSALMQVGLASLAFTAFLIFVVRPASTFASTTKSPLTWKERTFIAWLAPRGVVAAAVSSVFSIALAGLATSNPADVDSVAEAMQPAQEAAGGGQAELLVPVTFAVIITTVAFYGFTTPLVARRLGLAVSRPQGLLIAGAHQWARELASLLQDRGVPVALVDTNRRNVVRARLAGLNARAGGILAEDVLASLDMTHMGRLLALTPNNEVNTLAAQHFTSHFGRAEVYQLATGERDAAAVGAGEGGLTHAGRTLFSKEATFAAIAARFEAGAELHATPLSDEFTYDDYLEKYGRRALPMFVLGTAGGGGGGGGSGGANGTPGGGAAAGGTRVRIVVADEPATPQPGQSVVALIDPDVEAEPSTQSAAGGQVAPV